MFDHHHSETVRVGPQPNHIIDASAPSAARVIYNEFGGADFFTDVPLELMEAVDKADSAQYTMEEILDPTGWTLLNFLMDSRTGLGRFRDFTISNFDLMMKLIDACHQLESVDEILAMKDVRERSELFHAHTEPFIDQLRRVSTVHDDVVVVDLRDEDIIYAGNRFMVYALYPEARVSIHALWGRRQAEHGVRGGKVHCGPHVAGGHRLDHARVRRRRSPRGRHLPGGQRRRRAGARRAHPGARKASRLGLSYSTHLLRTDPRRSEPAQRTVRVDRGRSARAAR